MAREEYNGCNYGGANNVRIGDEPVAVKAPYRGETDDEAVHPVPAAPRTRLEETGVRGRDERLSRRDEYEFHREADYNDPPRGAPRVPHNSTPRLAKMDSYSGQGSESQEVFFDQVEEYTALYGWDGQEACRQVRAHLKNTVLSYVKRVPFAPRTWEELKALLLKRFQPRDLTATYKAQFRSRRRCNTQEIYSYMEALQRLADMAWPFMDHHAKEDLVVDQFLQGMESHELSVQVATSRCRRLETVLCIAQSLEAVHEEERHHSRGRKPSSQACFMSNERARSPDHKELVKEVLAQLGHGARSRERETHRRRPTHGPKRVRSADRREIQSSSSRTPSRNSHRGRSASSDRRSRSRDAPPQCFSCKGYGHFAKECPSEDFYRIGPNGLPVRVRDTSVI